MQQKYNYFFPLHYPSSSLPLSLACIILLMAALVSLLLVLKKINHFTFMFKIFNGFLFLEEKPNFSKGLIGPLWSGTCLPTTTVLKHRGLLAVSSVCSPLRFCNCYSLFCRTFFLQLSYILKADLLQFSPHMYVILLAVCPSDKSPPLTVPYFFHSSLSLSDYYTLIYYLPFLTTA